MQLSPYGSLVVPPEELTLVVFAFATAFLSLACALWWARWRLREARREAKELRERLDEGW